MMETAVENAANIFTVNRLLDEKKDIFYASMNTRDCMVVLSTELLLCLTTPVRHFRNFTMNITAYLETHRVAQKLTEYGKLRFDWSIQRSLGRPTQYNLVRCSYVEINIGILIRLISYHKALVVPSD